MSMANDGCIFCKLIRDEGSNIVYKDSHCAIIWNKYASANEKLQMVPLRHIRDINHLRPRMDTHKLADDGRIRIIVNPLNQLADIKLIAHMSETAKKFMKDSFLNKQEWAEYRNTNFGFYRPPINKHEHLSMHLLNSKEILEGK